MYLVCRRRIRVYQSNKRQAGSWEDVLHQNRGDPMLIFNQEKLSDDFQQVRGHRAIGVVYQPEFESYGNYVPTIFPKRYNAF
jgi:erythromycin esterase